MTTLNNRQAISISHHYFRRQYNTHLLRPVLRSKAKTSRWSKKSHRHSNALVVIRHYCFRRHGGHASRSRHSLNIARPGIQSVWKSEKEFILHSKQTGCRTAFNLMPDTFCDSLCIEYNTTAAGVHIRKLKAITMSRRALEKNRRSRRRRRQRKFGKSLVLLWKRRARKAIRKAQQQQHVSDYMNDNNLIVDSDSIEKSNSQQSMREGFNNYLTQVCKLNQAKHEISLNISDVSNVKSVDDDIDVLISDKLPKPLETEVPPHLANSPNRVTSFSDIESNMHCTNLIVGPDSISAEQSNSQQSMREAFNNEVCELNQTKHEISLNISDVSNVKSDDDDTDVLISDMMTPNQFETEAPLHPAKSPIFVTSFSDIETNMDCMKKLVSAEPINPANAENRRTSFSSTGHDYRLSKSLHRRRLSTMPLAPSIYRKSTKQLSAEKPTTDNKTDEQSKNPISIIQKLFEKLNPDPKIPKFTSRRNSIDSSSELEDFYGFDLQSISTAFTLPSITEPSDSVAATSKPKSLVAETAEPPASIVGTSAEPPSTTTVDDYTKPAKTDVIYVEQTANRENILAAKTKSGTTAVKPDTTFASTSNPKYCKLQTPNIHHRSGCGAFVSTALDTFMEENIVSLNLDAIPDVIATELTKQFPVTDAAIVTDTSKPPPLNSPVRKLYSDRPRTVAEKRLQMTQKDDNIEESMLDNASYIYRALKRRTGNSLSIRQTVATHIGAMRQQRVPFNRDYWRAASWLSTSIGRFYYQTVITSSGDEVSLPGGCGDFAERYAWRIPLGDVSLTAAEVSDHRRCRERCPSLGRLRVSNLNEWMRKVYPSTSVSATSHRKLLGSNPNSRVICRPCPLSKKKLNVTRDSLDSDLGPLRILSMPNVQLEVWPRVDRPQPEHVRTYLKMLAPTDCITGQWAQFAVSTLCNVAPKAAPPSIELMKMRCDQLRSTRSCNKESADDLMTKTATNSCDASPSFNVENGEQPFCFDIPYTNDQTCLLVRQRYKQVSVCTSQNNGDSLDVLDAANGRTTPLQFDRYVRSDDAVGMQVAEVLRNMMNAVSVACMEESAICDDPDLGCDEEMVKVLVKKTKKPVAQRVETHGPQKSVLRRELKRLDATVIDIFKPPLKGLFSFLPVSYFHILIIHILYMNTNVVHKSLYGINMFVIIVCYRSDQICVFRHIIIV